MLTTCSASTLLSAVLLPVALTLSGNPVVLTSSLTRRSLCPHDVAVTFACTASGTEIVWKINSYAHSFHQNSNAGEWDRRNGYYVTLETKMNASSPGEFIFTSVLTVSLSSEEFRRGFCVGCRNHQTSKMISEEYHSNSGQPSALANVFSTAKEVEKNVFLFNISWSQDTSNSSIDHYMVQVGSHSLNLSAENTIGSAENKSAYNIPMELPKFHSNILEISAVDICGQVGVASMSTIERFDSSSTTSVPHSTMTEKHLTDQPSNGSSHSAVIAGVALACSVICCALGVVSAKFLTRKKWNKKKWNKASFIALLSPSSSACSSPSTASSSMTSSPPSQQPSPTEEEATTPQPPAQSRSHSTGEPIPFDLSSAASPSNPNLVISIPIPPSNTVESR